MKGQDLFQAIHQCDDQYLEEVMETVGQKKVSGWRRLFFGNSPHASGIRIAAAFFLGILLLGSCVTMAATASSAFRNWLSQTFGGHEMSNLTEEKNKAEKANVLLQLKDNMEIQGTNESFVCQIRWEKEERIVEKVYSIQDNHLQPLDIYVFHGDYDGTPFSFEYSVIGQEICAFNYQGDLNAVFECIDGDFVYAELWEVEGDSITKGCIAALDLKTGTVIKLTDDDTICNSVMSPHGKMLLLNYRSEGYWTVFDMENRTEHKVKGINGYAHTNEIKFIDDYHVLAIGNPVWKDDTEITISNLIDLRTQQTIEQYQDYGEIQVEWHYKLKDGKIQLYNIMNGDSFTVNDSQAKDFHVVKSTGDFALLCADDSVYYLCNLKTQASMKIDMPKELYGKIDMYIASTEKKLLLTNGTEVYLVNIDPL